MTSIERTAYPQFKRVTSARVLHVFFTPTGEEIGWARARTASPEALFALVLELKCFQRAVRELMSSSSLRLGGAGSSETRCRAMDAAEGTTPALSRRGCRD
ncbi:hypothetical protein OHA34_03525 [Spirillospora sp. NBC_01491]|nr:MULTISPECIES: hypothetical protein [Thermomonosporaceae]MDL4776811.1 hypothetical protein [Actinomadura xylanilytica]